MRVLRVFPRRTNATPDDDLVRVGAPTRGEAGEFDEVRVSVAFTYDRQRAEELVRAWSPFAPTVRIGGPAYGEPGGDFVPGLYLKRGHVITSRGCPNSCWFCFVPRREGGLRELPVADGWIVHDSNLLACSRPHVERVFDMLRRQPERPRFVGGLEAARLEPWSARAVIGLKPRSVFFAFDGERAREPLAAAVRMMADAGWGSRGHRLCSYVLVGYKGDTFERAEGRLMFVARLGLMPFAMLYRDELGAVDPEWRTFQRHWVRPQIVGSLMAKLRREGS